MPTAFALAVDVIHRDPNWIEAATFTAPPQPAVAVTVYRARRDPILDFPGFETTARAAGWEAHVRQAEIQVVPQKGTDTLTIGPVTFAIRDVSEDVERTEWVLDLIEQ